MSSKKGTKKICSGSPNLRNSLFLYVYLFFSSVQLKDNELFFFFPSHSNLVRFAGALIYFFSLLSHQQFTIHLNFFSVSTLGILLLNFKSSVFRSRFWLLLHFTFFYIFKYFFSLTARRFHVAREHHIKLISHQSTQLIDVSNRTEPKPRRSLDVLKMKENKSETLELWRRRRSRREKKLISCCQALGFLLLRWKFALERYTIWFIYFLQSCRRIDQHYWTRTNIHFFLSCWFSAHFISANRSIISYLSLTTIRQFLLLPQSRLFVQLISLHVHYSLAGEIYIFSYFLTVSLRDGGRPQCDLSALCGYSRYAVISVINVYELNFFFCLCVWPMAIWLALVVNYLLFIESLCSERYKFFTNFANFHFQVGVSHNNTWPRLIRLIWFHARGGGTELCWRYRNSIVAANNNPFCFG